MDPDVAKTIKIGAAFLKEKKPEKAVKYYSEARELLDEKGMGNSQAHKAIICLGLCEAYFRLRDWDSVVAEAKKCNHDSANGWAWYWRAKACSELGKIDDAKVFAKKSYGSLGPQNKKLKRLLVDLKLDGIIENICGPSKEWQEE